MPKKSEVEFTENTVKTNKPKEKRYQIAARNKPGLLLRVQPTGSKAWFVVLDRNVKRRVGNAKSMTLDRAWRKAMKMITEFNEGKLDKSSRSKTQTLQEYLEGDYMELVKHDQKGAASNIARLIAACNSLLDKRLDKLTELHIEKWKAARLEVAKPTTVKRDLIGLKSALNKAVRPLKIIDRNPAGVGRGSVTVKTPKDDRVRWLSDKEREGLLEALRARDLHKINGRVSGNAHRRERGLQGLPELTGYADYLTPLVLLTMNTGLRRGEVLSLTWNNVNLNDRKEVTVRASYSKTNQTRRVPLNSEAVAALIKWKEQGSGKGLVFTNSVNGQRIEKLKTSWPNLLKDAEITDFRFHDLRHDFASRLVSKGVDLYRVKELMGHSTIKMTERYAHLRPEDLAEAVELLA